MRMKLIAFGATTTLIMAAFPALADHNSKDGEGTANMPNDIHNQRIETLESGDNEAFRDFVRYGEGSKVPNSLADDDTVAPQAQEMKGTATNTQSQQQTSAGDANMVMDQKKAQLRVHGEDGQTQQQAASDGEQKKLMEQKQLRENKPEDKASDRSVRTQSNRTSMNTNRTTTQRSTGRRGGDSRGGGGRRGGGRQ